MYIDKNLLDCLPTAVALALTRMGQDAQIYELRLRAGKPVQVILSSRSGWLSGSGRLLDTPEGALLTDAAALSETLFRATGRSMQSAMDGICRGYVSLPGGSRLGVAGTASVQGGQVLSVHSIQTLNFRFAAFLPDAADPLLRQLDSLTSLLIAGPPLSGKTTLLRSLIAKLSQGTKLAVLDERGELTPLPESALTADLLTGYPKAAAIELAVRTLSPQLLICDELSPLEASAVSGALHAGVPLIATIHAGSAEELLRRKWAVQLLEEGCFEKAVFLSDVGKIGKVMDARAVLSAGGGSLPAALRQRDRAVSGGPAAPAVSLAAKAGAALCPAGRTAWYAVADGGVDRYAGAGASAAAIG